MNCMRVAEAILSVYSAAVPLARVGCVFLGFTQQCCGAQPASPGLPLGSAVSSSLLGDDGLSRRMQRTLWLLPAENKGSRPFWMPRALSLLLPPQICRGKIEMPAWMP